MVPDMMPRRNKGKKELALSGPLLASVELAIMRCLFVSEASFTTAFGGTKNVNALYHRAALTHGAPGMRDKLQAEWEKWHETNSVSLKKARNKAYNSAVQSVTGGRERDADAAGGNMLQDLDASLGLDD